MTKVSKILGEQSTRTVSSILSPVQKDDLRVPDPKRSIIRQGPPADLTEKMLSVFRSSPEKLQAKTQNAINFSENLGISLHQAYDNHDAITKELGLRDQPLPEQMVGMAFTGAITAGLLSNPVSTILGVAAFEILGEAESAAISFAQDKKYQMFQKRGLADLLPDDINEITSTSIEILDFMWKAKAAKGFWDKAPKIRQAITKEIITEHKMPKEYFIDPADLKTELIGKEKVLPKEVADIYKGLGLKGPAVRRAIREGLTIRVPAENITLIKDRPWFAAVKRILKIDPMQPSRIKTDSGGATAEPGGGPKKQLEEGTREPATRTPEDELGDKMFALRSEHWKIKGEITKAEESGDKELLMSLRGRLGAVKSEYDALVSPEMAESAKKQKERQEIETRIAKQIQQAADPSAEAYDIDRRGTPEEALAAHMAATKYYNQVVEDLETGKKHADRYRELFSLHRGGKSGSGISLVDKPAEPEPGGQTPTDQLKGDFTVPLDESIRGVIQDINKAGITTEYSHSAVLEDHSDDLIGRMWGGKSDLNPDFYDSYLIVTKNTLPDGWRKGIPKGWKIKTMRGGVAVRFSTNVEGISPDEVSTKWSELRDHLVGKTGRKVGEPALDKPDRNSTRSPRVFYRGTEPGGEQNPNKIFDPKGAGDWVARDRNQAEGYGPRIETLAVKADTKILIEGTREYAEVVGITKWDDSKMMDPSGHEYMEEIPEFEHPEYDPSIHTYYDKYMDYTIRKVQAAGYDAVVFDNDGEIGTLILNDDAFLRQGTPSRPTAPFENTIPSARGTEKEIPAGTRTKGIDTFEDLETQAVKDTSRNVVAELGARDRYIKTLKKDAELVKRGDAKFADTTLNDDNEYKYDLRVVQEELKIFEKLVGGKDKSPRKTIRKTSGQVKVVNLISVDERTALRDQIRFEAKAARDAFRAGKKEAALAAKTRQKELLEKQKERKQQKAHVAKLIKTIRKDIPGTVDFAYREAIDLLREGIDPYFRTKKTMKGRENLREFLRRHPEAEANIPKKLLNQLNKKPLNDYTIEDLENITAEIAVLEKLGKLKRKLKLAQRKRDFEAIEAEIAETIFDGEIPDADIPVVKSTSKGGTISKSRLAVRATTLRPFRVFDMVDGGQNFKGPAVKFFIDSVNKATNSRLNIIDERHAYMAKAVETTGVDVKNLTEVREIGGVKYTVDEMIDIYMGYKNERKMLALQFGVKITQKRYDEIVGNLTPEEIGFGDFILEEYQNNYERLRQSVIDVENRDIGSEKFYSPIKRTEVDYSTSTKEVVDELLHRAGLKKAYASKGMTKLRKDIPKEYQKPIRLGAYSTWLSTIEMQEQYIHFAQIIKDMHRMLEGPVKEAINAKSELGPEYLRVMRRYVDRVANPNFYRSFGYFENLSKELRSNVALYYLAGNLLTMGKQFPSLMFYLPDAGPSALSASLADFAKDPKGVWDFVAKHDPQVRHRQIEREIEEMRKLSGSEYYRIKKKVGELGMFGIRMIDRAAITIGWNAVYQANVRELGHDGAMKMAQDVTLRTQPQAASKDLPDIYATSEYINWLLQFTNQLNQIYNIATYDIPQDIKSERWPHAMMSVLSLAISAIWIWMIQNKRVPESAEDVADALTEQAINTIPIIGKTISQSSKGWGNGGDITVLSDGVGEITKFISGKGRVSDLLEGMGLLVGAPGIAVKRTGKFLEKGDPVELFGGKPKRR